MYFTRESSDDAGFNITPMIDVVFLLIIFFMVTAQFANTVLSAAVILPAAENGRRIKDTALVINVDREGVYRITGIAYRIEELSSLVGMWCRDGRPVIIRADKAAAFKYIQKLQKILAENNLPRIAFGVSKKED